MVNEKFLDYIKPYLIKLREKIGDDFVVFGSAPLYLFGVVPFTGQINDLDVFVKDLTTIPRDAMTVTFHKNEKQKLFKIVIDDMEVDIGSSWPGYEDFVNKIYANPVVVEDFKFANLDVVEEWKREMVKRYDRQKDRDYLDKIAIYKKGQV